jgi:hypothetical protein
MNANDFAARLAVMEAALAKSGKPDTRKRDEPERALPGVQPMSLKEEVEWGLPSIIQRVDPKEQVEVKRAPPSAQRVSPKEQVAVELAPPSVQRASPKEEAEIERAVPTLQSPIPTNAVSEASDRSIVLAARIDRLDVQLDAINDLLRSLITDQAPTSPPNP